MRTFLSVLILLAFTATFFVFIGDVSSSSLGGAGPGVLLTSFDFFEITEITTTTPVNHDILTRDVYDGLVCTNLPSNSGEFDNGVFTNYKNVEDDAVLANRPSSLLWGANDYYIAKITGEPGAPDQTVDHPLKFINISSSIAGENYYNLVAENPESPRMTEVAGNQLPMTDYPLKFPAVDFCLIIVN